MTDGLPLDGRREKALREEMLRRAAAMLSDDGQMRPPGEVARALIGVAARIGEEVTRRLDRVPGKQVRNLFGAMGIGGDPARPARVPVAFRLADPAPADLVAPASTRLMASGEAGAVVFETDRAIALAPGSISALVAVDAGKDQIFLPPAGVIDPALPREPAVERALRSGAGAGTDKLQVSLAAGLELGAILRIGADGEAAEHRIVALEDDLVTIEPPLERTFGAGARVAVVTDFTTFAGHRNRQTHAFYIGDEDLLNVPSALSIAMSGVGLPEATRWSWWGGDPPRWHDLVAAPAGRRLVLTKQEGQPVKKEISGRESLWLRALLPSGSAEAIEARDIRLSIGGRGDDKAPAKDLEAIANTTPLVLNSAFHPFGREPRLFDSFYIGCAEAFSKPGAAVSLAFKFAGPELGPLAMVASGGLVQIFGVGEDGLFYRAQFGKGQPRLLSIDLRRGKAQAASPPARSPVAARMAGKRVFVAVGGAGSVYFADLPFEEPVDAASVEWKILVGEAGDSNLIDRIAIVEENGKPVVLAQAGARVSGWTEPATMPPAKLRGEKLVPLQRADSALVIGAVEGGRRTVTSIGAVGGAHTVGDTALPKLDLAGWAAGGAIVFLAGYQIEAGKAVLRVVRVDLRDGTVKPLATPPAGELPEPPVAAPGRWPIAFQPPPPPIADAANAPPTIVLASPTPMRLVWHGDADGYRSVESASAIGISDNPHRHFASAPGWIAVHHGTSGLHYRPAGKEGEWTEEFLLSAMPERLEVAQSVPDAPVYAAPSWKPQGNGFEIRRSATDERALLRPSPGPRRPMIACFFVDSQSPEGRVEVEGQRVRLIDEAALAKWKSAKAEAEKRAGLATQAETDLGPLRTRATEAARQAQLAKQTYEADEKSLTAATTKADAARKKVSDEESALDWFTTAHEQAKADLADLKAKTDPAATESEIEFAEADVTAAKTSEDEARAKLTRAEDDASKPLSDESDAQKKRDASLRLSETQTAEARALETQVTEAEGELRTKQEERDQAIEEADGLSDVSASAAGDEVVVRVFAAGEVQDPRQLWHLKPSADPQYWDRPAGSGPGAFPTGTDLRYKLLDRKDERPVEPAVGILHPEQFEARVAELGEERPLRFHAQPHLPIAALRKFPDPPGPDIATLAVPPDLFGPGRNSELLTTATEEWRTLGPAQPPNPGLSWEYWNGDSWWALDGTRLVDRTSNLLLDGTVSFTVPADLKETDVGGRANHWIRARLVGGDYGEAQVTVKSVPAPGGETRQTVERDMSTIRAPYVTSFSLGFSAQNEVRPDVILTEDSLGVVDQGPANRAGLPFRVFTPVGAEMNPAGSPAPLFERGLMIGFAKPVRGDPVSLYVDSAPGGAAATLIAEIYRDGRFERIQMRDETRGLSEPGMIQLSLQRAPDQTELFGTAAHWVRLSPSAAADGWVPRLRGVHLNAAYADSVETRELESLGHSSGIPKQLFRLAGAPVDVGSLDLRVAEPLGEEDLLSGTLDVVATAGAKVAHWVRWSEVEDFSAADGRARAFLLDPETGLIQFGDGRRGAIPPLGAELLARLYRCVAGEAGNKVAPGAALQLVSPLAGIERVTALDAAAGGSDAETGEQALRRGTAKLRHGDRIVTLADLEDHVLARSPAIAQVRAVNRGGAVRLIVAAKGPEPRPGPAMLRALERSVREAAGYGVARAGGVDIVAPRLLPLRVKLTLEPDDPDKYVEMADSAEAELVKLFDPAAGGFDGQGWPLGRAPVASDIAAALEPVGRFGVASIDAIERADRREPKAFPPTIPPDVLVRLDPNDVVSERRAKETA